MRFVKAHRLSFLSTSLAFCLLNGWYAFGESPKAAQQTILFGAAYYEEYSPTDRLDEDVRMMKATGITVVRIAESTWGTLETQKGVFDFSHVDRVLNAMDNAGIKVIVGTPTYAIPTAHAHNRYHPRAIPSSRLGQVRGGHAKHTKAKQLCHLAAQLLRTKDPCLPGSRIAHGWEPTSS